MNIEKISNLSIPPIEQTYDRRDTILYALGLGYGADPLDLEELPFLYEGDLRCVPSYVNVLCHPGFWAQRPEFGIDWVKILHAEQEFNIHKPLPSVGSVRGCYGVHGVEDKGEERGALLHQEKTLYDARDGALLATVRSTLFLRGDGGQGGFGEAIPAAPPLPERAPDRSVDIRTAPGQALIYRLSGDWNPLHADPEVARQAGFSAPILHGLCANGIACRALLSMYCDNDVSRFASMFVRFSRPIVPGDTIRLEIHEVSDGVRFRAISLASGAVVLDRCRASFR